MNSFSLNQEQRQNKSNLLSVFYVLAATLLIYELFAETPSFWLNIICISVTAIALAPSYFWVTGKALGMPVFPLFALTFIWTYALPLVSDNPNVLIYSVDQRLFAGFTTISFLAVGCIFWFRLVRRSRAPMPRSSYRLLVGNKSDSVFFITLAISVLFNIASVGGWLNALALSGGAFSLLRNTVVAFTALSSFVLSYKLGKEELNRQEVNMLSFLLASFIVSSTLEFLLISAATVFLTSVAAFVIGRRRVPVALLLTIVLCFSFLHAGKAEMRSRYWGSYGQLSYIQPWQYPTAYAEWIEASIGEISNRKDESDYSSRSSQTFEDRASVVQMMMLSQSMSPQTVPFLNGYTYQILPEMMVPRIIHPKKPWSHEGTYRLNIHYGRQTREQTRRTTIAWGLLAESYANFGYWGCIGLAVILGSVYGWVGRLSIHAPILSLHSLVAVFFMTYATQSEWTAGVYVAAITQHGVVLAAMAIFLMRERPSEQFEMFNRHNRLRSVLTGLSKSRTR